MVLAVAALSAFVGPPALDGPAGPTGSGVALAAPSGPVGSGEPSDVPPGELPAPAASPAEVRGAADDVLSGREFQRAEPNLIDRALDWVSEQIGRILQRVTTGDGASLLGWAVMVGAIVAIVVLLVRFGRTVQRDPGHDAEVRVDRSRTAAQWEDEAEQHEAEGEWKLALRCRFRALIATLVERGRVDDVPGRTTGEYRAEVRAGLPEAADAFAGATYLFEDAWYGDEPTGAAENARFRALAADVLAHAPKGTVAVVVTDAEAVPA
ncbi:MAG TPA: DUF4129 domain-containing protein [Acidimicrobiales bacterium]|nr:DUF4129 domain-containing protein [Acidimicrobiales bacterium]